jgi:hypothetical protein
MSIENLKKGGRVFGPIRSKIVKEREGENSPLTFEF